MGHLEEESVTTPEPRDWVAGEVGKCVWGVFVPDCLEPASASNPIEGSLHSQFPVFARSRNKHNKDDNILDKQ
jgi:hypothetical protein